MKPSSTHAQAWLDTLCAQQDYLWFVAITLSGAVLLTWWRHPRRGERQWVAWGALTTAAHGIAGIATFVSPFVERSKPPDGAPPPHLTVDLFMGGTAAALAAAWWWLLAASLPRGRWLRWVGPGLFTALWWLRKDQPSLGGWALAGSLTLLVATHLRTHGRKPLAVSAALLVAAAWFSTWGPVADSAQLLQRWKEWNPLSLVCAALLSAAQLAALVGLLGEILLSLPPERRTALHRLARPFVLAAGGWLAAGLLMAVIAGRSARQSFEVAALSRVSAAAALLDPAGLDDALGSKFRPGTERTFVKPSGEALAYFYAASVTNEKISGTVAQLRKFFQINPDLSYALILTPRQGELFVAITLGKAAQFSGAVYSLRPLLPADHDRWIRGAPHIEAGTAARGSMFMARAPVLSAAGRRLGWLQFDFSIGLWAAAQAQARLLTFGVVSMGFGLLALLFLQQSRERERAAALQAASAAEHANRLKTTFLANVSHELRTPIQSILGYAELLHGSLRGDVEHTRLAALRQHGELMIRLVNDLIDLGMLDSGAFRLVEKSFALKRLVTEIVESLAPRAEAKGLKLTCHVDEGTPAWVVSDPERVRQVLLNLVGNAVKYTRRGRVDVFLTPKPAPVGLHRVELVVRDTGPGIQPAEQRRLFEPFSRLANAAEHEGAGLGLALTAGLCRRLGDGLAIESDGVSGSLFRTTFDFRAGTQPVPTRSVERGALAGWRILVADDNALVRDLFVAYLVELGAECITAANGHEAVVQAADPALRALVLDLAMPGLDGTEVARQIRATGRRLRIIGVSAHAGGIERAAALAAGMDEFLSKPIELPALALALDPAVAPAAPVDPWPQRRAQWETCLRAELPDALRGMVAALDDTSWESLRQRAHHLKNSAMVVRDDELFDACGNLESAAARTDTAAARAAWSACLAAAARWGAPAEEFRPHSRPS